MPRLTMNVTDDILATLQQHAQDRGVTLTEYVRQAISTEVFFDQQIEAGYGVALTKNDRLVKEVLLRR